MLVLTYPHFLYADSRYRNSVLGMTPDENKHIIFVDIEPNTGTPIAAAKRVQFNIFQRPISGIPLTQDLRTALVPVVWVEESFLLPDTYRDELRERLLGPLNLLDILIPVGISMCAMVLLFGILCSVRAKLIKTSADTESENKY
ncbi:Sensory neuron membrane protein 2, partial [Operophtera brumata]